MVIISQNLEETKEAAQQALTILKENDSIVVALHGDLGSGKTTFTQALAKELGVEEHLTSPTFVLQKYYQLPTSFGQKNQIIHIDAYRLEKSSELSSLGWNSISQDPTNLIMLEWPERVKDIIPENAFHIHFTFIDEKTRKIEFNG